MFQYKKMQLIVYLVSYLSLVTVSGFNISPRPNLVFKETTPRYYQENNRSSYFGFSINLRKSSIIVGAPRSQPTLEKQRNIKETGAIYKCSFKTKECDPFVFDKEGNVINSSSKELISELKDMQLLGAAGRPNDFDKLVVCAPRQMTSAVGVPWMLSGICYWTSDTLDSQPVVTKIAPHRLRKDLQRLHEGQSVDYHLNAELGHSVHVTENNEEILIGAIGILSYSDTFTGRQFGEYFGYSLLSEDFNGDGLLDLAISAPFYSADNRSEHGAVYIYLNTGERKLRMKRNKILTTGNSSPGHFGTTLSKLGDINGDGYNDIAIGAPFEENGAVYIFLGSATGLNDKPSQILRSPIDQVNNQSMFGHGISRGVDIDSNRYNELAIGAPNSKTVYLYKTYPVVKIIAFTQSPNPSTDQLNFKIRVYWQLNSTSNQRIQQELKITLKVDLKVKRIFFDDGNNVKEFQEMAGQLKNYKDFNVTIKHYQYIYKVIEIELHYELINKIPDSEDFCEDCVAINPKDAKYSTEKITFITGCKSKFCASDLQLSSSGFNSPFILGSNQTQTMTYSIRNIGEYSYLTRLSITTSSQMPFAKIPPFCKSDENELLCEVFKGQKMLNGSEENFEIIFDTTNLDGRQVIIQAKAINTGSELNSNDNDRVDTIHLMKYAEFHILPDPAPTVTLNNNLRTEEITNVIEIRNNGPSTIKDMDVLLYIPVSYLVPETQTRIQVIDFHNIMIVGMHYSRTMETEFRQNNTIIIQDPSQRRSTESSLDDNIIDSDSGLQNVISSKKKRSVEIDETAALSNNSGTEIGESSFDRLPVDRKTLFSCDTSMETRCIQAAVSINNFEPGDNVIRITITYNVDLNQINKILTTSKNFFVLTTLVNISKNGDEEWEKIKLHKKNPEIIFEIKIEAEPTPSWVIILSVIAGLLLVTLMTYSFYRMGFFRRQKKEELAKLVRQSKLISVD